MKGLGFTEMQAAQAFFACEKNEMMAANFLFENAESLRQEAEEEGPPPAAPRPAAQNIPRPAAPSMAPVAPSVPPQVPPQAPPQPAPQPPIAEVKKEEKKADESKPSTGEAKPEEKK